MKYFLIMNPGSRGGSSKKKFETIFKILDEAKVEYNYKITKSLDDAYQFSVEANKAGYDVIAAVGGDGTINRVMNGFFDDAGNRISDSAFGVIYTGTSPDFCKSYNIPTNIKDAAKVLLINNTVEIQIGKISYMKSYHKELDGKPLNFSDGDIETGYFGCCANIGLGAMVARNANSGIRKKLGDYAGTFLSLLKTLTEYKAGDYTICRDNGNQEILRKTYNISVGRTFYIASGIKVKNELKQGDGRFYTLIVKDIKANEWLSVFKKIYSGEEMKNNNTVSVDYCSSLEVYGNNQNPEIEFDGDPMGFLPCKIEVAKDGLKISTPFLSFPQN